MENAEKREALQVKLYKQYIMNLIRFQLQKKQRLIDKDTAIRLREAQSTLLDLNDKNAMESLVRDLPGVLSFENFKKNKLKNE